MPRKSNKLKKMRRSRKRKDGSESFSQSPQVKSRSRSPPPPMRKRIQEATRKLTKKRRSPVKKTHNPFRMMKLIQKAAAGGYTLSDHKIRTPRRSSSRSSNRSSNSSHSPSKRKMW